MAKDFKIGKGDTSYQYIGQDTVVVDKLKLRSLLNQSQVSYQESKSNIIQ